VPLRPKPHRLAVPHELPVVAKTHFDVTFVERFAS
jgi:hypothetical protein